MGHLAKAFWNTHKVTTSSIVSPSRNVGFQQLVALRLSYVILFFKNKINLSNFASANLESKRMSSTEQVTTRSKDVKPAQSVGNAFPSYNRFCVFLRLPDNKTRDFKIQSQALSLQKEPFVKFLATSIRKLLCCFSFLIQGRSDRT